MGIKKLFLDKENFSELSTDEVNVNIIETKAFPYMDTHTGTISNLQTVSLQGVELVEVAVTDIDNESNEGKYAVTSNNTIMFIVDKTLYDTEEKAKKYLMGILVEYDMDSIAYSSTDYLYTMETRLSNGTIVGNTSDSSLSVITEKIKCLDANQDINAEGGYYIHTLIRGIKLA
jgi:hypothetical protein